MDNELLPSQMEQLVSLIASSGIPMDDFGWTRVSGDWIGIYSTRFPAIIHKSEYSFVIAELPASDDPGGSFPNGSFCILARPGAETRRDESTGLRWSDVVTAFQRWLVNLRRELRIPAPAKNSA